jgi:hypothetical protein
VTLWRIRATVDDRPGFLSVLTASLALKAINILSVQVHTTEAGAVDEFLVEAPDELTVSDMVAAVIRGRGSDPWVSRADVRGLVDEPTRVLGLAARVVADPGELEAALVDLLGPCEVISRPDAIGGREGFTPGAMALADPAGGTLVIRRPEPAFTPAENARAHALVRLAAVATSEAAPEAP